MTTGAGRDAPVILVVDDDAAGRYVVARLLRQERFAVDEAADASGFEPRDLLGTIRRLLATPERS